MQKKIKSRYTNKYVKTYSLKYLPYAYYLEEKGVCALINLKKSNK